jgi:hypothetical protein
MALASIVVKIARAHPRFIKQRVQRNVLVLDRVIDLKA